MTSPLRTYNVNRATVGVYGTKSQMGRAAAADAARIMCEAIERQGHVRIIVATGNSQIDLIEALTNGGAPLKWNSAEVFHMDEYVGMSSSHPASFARWLETRVTDVVHPNKMHYLRGDAPDLQEEVTRYSSLVKSAAIDLCLLGFGENGHIAFNDPSVADFHDRLTVKRVTLENKCRLQQVGEGHFPDLGAVPEEALTLTCPALMSARHLICCVPERRKAEAVRDALEGPLSTSCPASLTVTHPRARIYLDTDSASLLNLSTVPR